MPPERSRLLTRIGLGLLAATSLELGVWAAFAPRSFFDSFPGAGHHWVVVDGPYNQHLVRDFGQHNLAFFILLAAAAITLERRLRQVVLVAYVVAAALHLIYHLGHLGLYDTTDAIANVVSLGLVVVIPLALLAADQIGGWAEARPARQT
jgi:hypothetical protein